MSEPSLQIPVSSAAKQRLRELDLTCKNQGKAIGLVYVEVEREVRGHIKTTADWRIQLFDLASVEDLPGWYLIEEFRMFVPSWHLLNLLSDKTLDYRDSEFVIVRSSGNSSTS